MGVCDEESGRVCDGVSLRRSGRDVREWGVGGCRRESERGVSARGVRVRESGRGVREWEGSASERVRGVRGW